jgi:RHS repeat-associated protein
VFYQRWRSSSGDVDRYQYGHDRDSSRLWRDNLVNAAFGELYNYDGLNQLTSMDRGTLNGTKTGLTGGASRSQDWDYDALGNWDSVTTDSGTQTRNHNAQNEITSISGATTPTYDANGNLTTDETGRTFKYDAWNRLAEVKNSLGSTIVTYKYDALSAKVSETSGGNTRDFYYSSTWQMLEERLNGTTDTRYVWSPVYIDAMILRDRDTDANGSLDERLYALHDANFNVTALVNTSGTVVERFTYDAFGAVTVYDASWSVRTGGSSYGWLYLHQGGRWEGATGLYQFRNREYSPTLGRWLQLDPIGFEAQDLNLERAVGNNPISFLDPEGLDDAGVRDYIAQQKKKGWVVERMAPELSDMNDQMTEIRRKTEERPGPHGTKRTVTIWRESQVQEWAIANGTEVDLGCVKKDTEIYSANIATGRSNSPITINISLGGNKHHLGGDVSISIPISDIVTHTKETALSYPLDKGFKYFDVLLVQVDMRVTDHLSTRGRTRVVRTGGLFNQFGDFENPKVIRKGFILFKQKCCETNE